MARQDETASRDREPSIEEILASIKRIIADDEQQAASAPRPGQHDDAVLELTTGDAVAETGASDDADAPEAALLNGSTARSVRMSLAALATLAEPGQPPQIVRAGETSLEGLVRDMLRPMLKEWLDAQLPALVEALIAKEIQRVTRR